MGTTVPWLNRFRPLQSYYLLTGVELERGSRDGLSEVCFPHALPVKECLASERNGNAPRQVDCMMALERMLFFWTIYSSFDRIL